MHRAHIHCHTDLELTHLMLGTVARKSDSYVEQFAGEAGVIDGSVGWVSETLLLAAHVSAGMVTGKRSRSVLEGFPSGELTPEFEDGRSYSFRRGRRKNPGS